MDNKKLSEFVGERIRYYRTKKKFTQKELGEIIGVKNNTISDYERGVISPEQDMLFALSGALDININDLFPKKEHTSDELDRALEMVEGLGVKDVELLNTLIEKTLSLNNEEREKFLESIRFTVEYYNKMN